MVVKFLSRIEPVRYKKVVKQDKKQRVEHIPGPCTGETGAEVEKRRIPVFRFIIKIACDKEEQRQVEQIDERTGEISGMPQHDRNNAPSLYDIPVEGTGFFLCVHEWISLWLNSIFYK